MLHVAAHRQAAHVVGVVEVVFDVELVEVERGDEGSVFGREEWGAEEGEDEVGPVDWEGRIVSGWGEDAVGWCGSEAGEGGGG